jgi:hypothetical protein
MARTTNLLCLLASFQVGCVSCSLPRAVAASDTREEPLGEKITMRVFRSRRNAATTM